MKDSVQPLPSFDTDEERDTGASDAALAYLHALYRHDIPALQVAIETSTGEHKRRLQMVLADVGAQCGKNQPPRCGAADVIVPAFAT